MTKQVRILEQRKRTGQPLSLAEAYAANNKEAPAAPQVAVKLDEHGRPAIRQPATMITVDEVDG